MKAERKRRRWRRSKRKATVTRSGRKVEEIASTQTIKYVGIIARKPSFIDKIGPGGRRGHERFLGKCGVK